MGVDSLGLLQLTKKTSSSQASATRSEGSMGIVFGGSGDGRWLRIISMGGEQWYVPVAIELVETFCQAKLAKVTESPGSIYKVSRKYIRYRYQLLGEV
jgi:hypothetical protein